MKRALPFILVVTIASLSCNFITPTSAGSSLSESFQDDFSSSDSGWESATFDDGSFRQYQDNAYRIFVNTPDSVLLSIWGYPNGRFVHDVRIEVDATDLSDGTIDTGYLGVICRYTKTDVGGDFYVFIVDPGGFTVIEKVAGKDTTRLTEDGLKTPPLQTGGAANHIRADCIGDTLTLYINDQQIASATDSDFDGAYVGLGVGIQGWAGADFSFDNFVVTSP